MNNRSLPNLLFHWLNLINDEPELGSQGSPSMGHRWDHAELPSMGLRNFCQGIKNTFLRDFYEKRLKMNNLHDSISSRECSECKKCIRNQTCQFFSPIDGPSMSHRGAVHGKAFLDPNFTHGWPMGGACMAMHGSSWDLSTEV